MLVGEVPPDALERMQKAPDDPLEPIDEDESDLASIIHTLLAMKPEDRF